MALYNESLTARFNNLIRRLHSMKGRAPAPQVAPEIGHFIQLHDYPEQQSHHYLAGTTRYASGLISVAGDATHFGVVQFTNPAASGVLAIVESLEAVGILSNSFLIVGFIAGAIAGSVGASSPLDSRESPTKKSVLVNTISGTTVVGTSGNLLGRVYNPYGFPGNIEFLPARGLVMAPGAVLSVFSQAINTLSACQLVHRERAIEPGET